VILAEDDMIVTGMEVHRVTVGDVSCGGCGGDERGPGTGELMAASAARPDGEEPATAVAGGLATVVYPGAGGLARGSQVQVKTTDDVSDFGWLPYQDTADIVVNDVPGPDKPLADGPGTKVIQQAVIKAPEQGKLLPGAGRPGMTGPRTGHEPGTRAFSGRLPPRCGRCRRTPLAARSG
jgi:hypothetical protein